jgi:hypothetical protein
MNMYDDADVARFEPMLRDVARQDGVGMFGDHDEIRFKGLSVTNLGNS